MIGRVEKKLIMLKRKRDRYLQQKMDEKQAEKQRFPSPPSGLKFEFELLDNWIYKRELHSIL